MHDLSQFSNKHSKCFDSKVAIRDLKQTGRQGDDDGYSHNDIPDLVQNK
jgi:hypothetical protein